MFCAASACADGPWSGNLGQDTSGLANNGAVLGGVSQVPGAYGGSSGAFFDGVSGTRIAAGPLTGYTGVPGFSMVCRAWHVTWR